MAAGRRAALPPGGPVQPGPARRRWLRAGLACALGVAGGLPARAQAPSVAPPVQPGARPPLLKARRLQPGDTLGLVSPSSAQFERAPLELAIESLQALGFKVRQAPNLRARHGHLAGTDAQRAGDFNALLADPGVHGILALNGGSGAHRILPLLDYEATRRTPKFIGGFSDVTAIVNAVQARTGLVTFHCPMASSEWNAFSVQHFRGTVMEAQAMLLANPQDREDLLVPRAGRTRALRPGRARGVLVGGNLAVLAAMAGSAFWPRFDGAILCLEEVNEYIYRVDRMLATLKLAGAFERLAGVVLGAFTNCTPGEGFGTLTLDEVFDDYFGGLGVPVYSGASFGHIRRKFTLPIGLPAEMDAEAGTLRLLESAVL